MMKDVSGFPGQVRRKQNGPSKNRRRTRGANIRMASHMTRDWAIAAILIMALYMAADNRAHQTNPLFDHTPACIRVTKAPESGCIQFPNHPVRLIHHHRRDRH